MRVIFLQNIKGTAQIGDIKNVSDGYARNFLLPRGLVRAATGNAMKQAETLKKRRTEVYARDKETALTVAKRLEELAAASPNGVVLEFTEDANDEGHLYGSVGERQIVQALAAHKINIHEDQVVMPAHLKQVGEHEVELELHPEVKTKIKILVSAAK